MWFIKPINAVTLVVAVSLVCQTSADIPVGVMNGQMSETDTTLTITYTTPNVDPKVFLALIRPNQLNCNINGVEDIFNLPGDAKWPLEWAINDSGEVKIRLTKKKPGKWGKLDTNPDQDNYKVYKRDFWPAVIDSITPVTPDSFHVQIRFSENIFHYVPVGYHMQFRKGIEDEIRAYTPVPLLPKEGEYNPGPWRKTDEKLNFLIKRYISQGVKIKFSQWVTTSVGTHDIYLSNVKGKFTNAAFNGKKELYLYAAGTGITPMIGIIVWALKYTSANVKLLYFNRSPEDAIWKKELDNLDNLSDKFSIVYTYSGTNWNGYADYKGPKGRITKKIMEDNMPTANKAVQLVCMCGPANFVEFVEDTLLFPFKYDQRDYVRFLGKRSEYPKSLAEYNERYKGQV